MEERTMDLALEQKFQEMVDEVAAIGTVVDSNDALLDNLAQMLADAIANSANLEEIKTKVGDVKNLIITQKDKLSAAVVAHTPAA
jgi:peptidoglycan hydrolase CwlO-like protein